MKDSVEYAVWQTALSRDADPGVVLSTFWLDLPLSNGRLSFCVILNHKYRQPTAQPQKKTDGFVYRDPEPIRGILVLPDAVCRYVRKILKDNGIPHVVGIGSDDGCWIVRPEDPVSYLN